MWHFLAMANNYGNIHFKSTNNFTTVSHMVCRHFLPQIVLASRRPKHSCVHCSAWKKTFFHPQLLREAITQLIHKPSTFNWQPFGKHEFLTVPFYQPAVAIWQDLHRVSQSFKTSCCPVKAFELAYASELEIIKVAHTTTLGMAKKMQRNITCVWNC